ncbi:WD repeat and FYVE domain-containing protein 3 [Balamuthia mandrillaris]
MQSAAIQTEKVLSDFLLLLTTEEKNRDMFLAQKHWETWLLALLAKQEALLSGSSSSDSQSSTTAESPLLFNNVFSLLVNIFVLLFYHTLLKENGWKTIERFQVTLHHFSDSFLSMPARLEFTRQINNSLLQRINSDEHILPFLRPNSASSVSGPSRGGVSTTSMSTATSNGAEVGEVNFFVWQNVTRWVLFVEECLFVFPRVDFPVIPDSPQEQRRAKDNGMLEGYDTFVEDVEFRVVEETEMFHTTRAQQDDGESSFIPPVPLAYAQSTIDSTISRHYLLQFHPSRHHPFSTSTSPPLPSFSYAFFNANYQQAPNATATGPSVIPTPASRPQKEDKWADFNLCQRLLNFMDILLEASAAMLSSPSFSVGISPSHPIRRFSFARNRQRSEQEENQRRRRTVEDTTTRLLQLSLRLSLYTLHEADVIFDTKRLTQRTQEINAVAQLMNKYCETVAGGSPPPSLLPLSLKEEKEEKKVTATTTTDKETNQSEQSLNLSGSSFAPSSPSLASSISKARKASSQNAATHLSKTLEVYMNGKKDACSNELKEVKQIYTKCTQRVRSATRTFLQQYLHQEEEESNKGKEGLSSSRRNNRAQALKQKREEEEQDSTGRGGRASQPNNDLLLRVMYVMWFLYKTMKRSHTNDGIGTEIMWELFHELSNDVLLQHEHKFGIKFPEDEKQIVSRAPSDTIDDAIATEDPSGGKDKDKDKDKGLLSGIFKRMDLQKDEPQEPHPVLNVVYDVSPYLMKMFATKGAFLFTQPWASSSSFFASFMASFGAANNNSDAPPLYSGYAASSNSDDIDADALFLRRVEESLRVMLRAELDYAYSQSCYLSQKKSLVQASVQRQARLEQHLVTHFNRKYEILIEHAHNAKQSRKEVEQLATDINEDHLHKLWGRTELLVRFSLWETACPLPSTAHTVSRTLFDRLLLSSALFSSSLQLRVKKLEGYARTRRLLGADLHPKNFSNCFQSTAAPTAVEEEVENHEEAEELMSAERQRGRKRAGTVTGVATSQSKPPQATSLCSLPGSQHVDEVTIMGELSSTIDNTSGQEGKKKKKKKKSLADLIKEVGGSTMKPNVEQYFNAQRNKESEALKSIHTTACFLITPLITTPGNLVLTANHLFFFPSDSTITTTSSSSLSSSTSSRSSMYASGDKKNPWLVALERKQHQKRRKWTLAKLVGIYARRHLLRHCAFEIFLENNKTFFFAFDNKNVRDTCFKKIVAQRSAQGTVSALQGRATLSVPPSKALHRSGLTQRWVEGYLSNFEYLMHLNTFAGRTYNDITQYPIFPWILQDYESERLDLNDPSSFRDLSKPVGALNPERLQEFLTRYEMFEDAEIPKFLYGSHYSSAAVVLFFLVRVEPFTSYFLALQGGKFDHPDRMFHTITDTWKNCLTNPSDVKELIPELFYMPELFTNVNNIEFGHKADSQPMSDVSLPPWANGDPHSFIRQHREALESNYVSQHLHEWIDLIFGYKQQGAAALEAHNIFFHLTYEGTVDWQSITDPVQRSSIKSQISNFGQTPPQLFKKPHPQRKIKKQPIAQTPPPSSSSSLPQTPEKSPALPPQSPSLFSSAAPVSPLLLSSSSAELLNAPPPTSSNVFPVQGRRLDEEHQLLPRRSLQKRNPYYYRLPTQCSCPLIHISSLSHHKLVLIHSDGTMSINQFKPRRKEFYPATAAINAISAITQTITTPFTSSSSLSLLSSPTDSSPTVASATTAAVTTTAPITTPILSKEKPATPFEFKLDSLLNTAKQRRIHELLPRIAASSTRSSSYYNDANLFQNYAITNCYNNNYLPANFQLNIYSHNSNYTTALNYKEKEELLLSCSGSWDNGNTPSYHNGFRLISLENMDSYRTVSFHTDTVTALTLAADNDTIVTASANGILFVWSLTELINGGDLHLMTRGEHEIFEALASVSGPVGASSASSSASSSPRDETSGSNNRSEERLAQQSSPQSLLGAEYGSNIGEVTAAPSITGMAAADMEHSLLLPRRTLWGHNDRITGVFASTEFGVVVSSSVDGSILVHLLSDGSILCCINRWDQVLFGTSSSSLEKEGEEDEEDIYRSSYSYNAIVHMITVSKTSGNIVSCVSITTSQRPQASKTYLCVHSLNGQLLSRIEYSMLYRRPPNCMTLIKSPSPPPAFLWPPSPTTSSTSSTTNNWDRKTKTEEEEQQQQRYKPVYLGGINDEELLLTGGIEGLTVWRFPSLQELCHIPLNFSPITSVCLVEEMFICAGTESGQLCVIPWWNIVHDTDLPPQTHLP